MRVSSAPPSSALAPPTLASVALGARAVVTALESCPNVSLRRLAELGLRPGAAVRCVVRTAGGGRVVDIAGSRVALGREVLRAVAVTPETS